MSPTTGRVWIGRLTDGRTARSVEVDVVVRPDGLVLSGRHADHPPAIWIYDGLASNVPLHGALGEVVVTPRAMPGATLTVADHDFVRALRAAAPHLGVKAARLGGMRPGLAVGAAVFMTTAIVFALDLSPSKGIASLMPMKARDMLGERVLMSLPSRKVCDASAGQSALRALVQRLAPDDPRAGQQVIVLDWNIVNAFAVPGGRVVLTRSILQRAASADEIAGVVAHELGHGAELHPEAGLVRSVGFWALIQMVFTGTPGAIGNAGQILAQLAYSRTAEREADDLALAMLRKAGVSPRPFAGLFRRLEGSGSTPRSSTGRLPASDLFSTHPATPERIAKIEGQPTYPTTPALDEQQWRDLRLICGADIVVPPSTMGGSPNATTPPSAPAAQDIEKQIALITAQIARVPKDPFPYSQRAQLYVRKDMLQEALIDFDRAVELAPRNAGYRNARGNLHVRMRDYSRAEADYTESIKLNPYATLPRSARGIVHRLEKRYDAAHADFDAVLAESPTDEYALFNRGLTFRDQQRWPDARRDLDAVIGRNAKHPTALTIRGEVLEKLGERDKAIADFRAALALPSTSNAARARTRLIELGEKL